MLHQTSYFFEANVIVIRERMSPMKSALHRIYKQESGKAKKECYGPLVYWGWLWVGKLQPFFDAHYPLIHSVNGRLLSGVG